MTKRIRRYLPACALFLCAAILVAAPAGAVPVEISYQGYLTDSGGAPLEGPTSVTFRLYPAVNAITEVWSESGTVNVVGGVFHAVLGADTAGNPIDLAHFNGELWLGVTVGGEELAPRRKIAAAAYAVRAVSAERADGVPDGAVTDAKITGPVSASKIAQGPGSGLDADTLDGTHAAGLQVRVTGACPPGQSISAVNDDGSVTCQSAGPGGGIASNYVPRSDGAGLVAGSIFDNGSIGIGTEAPGAKLDVLAVAPDTYGPWLDYDAWYTPCVHCTDTCDGDDVAEYACPDGVSLACEDIRGSDGEYWEYRVVGCDQPLAAARFTGNVSVTGEVQGGNFVGDGSGLTGVTADRIAIDCPDGYILQMTTAGWLCRTLPAACRNGDYVGCYDGPSGTLGVGLCSGGTRTCTGGAYSSVCAGQIKPATETCDGEDNDCNGTVDDGAPGAVGCTTFYVDLDDDGYGDADDPGVCLCAKPAGYSEFNTDCRDDNAGVHPSAGYQAFPIPVGPGDPVNWDWNCSGAVEQAYTDFYSYCSTYNYSCSGDGWTGTLIPECGVEDDWTNCGYDTYGACISFPARKIQICR